MIDSPAAAAALREYKPHASESVAPLPLGQ
jgi:hypothetical protein